MICANPSCRREFARPPGSKRKTCSDACRRARTSVAGMTDEERAARSRASKLRFTSPEARQAQSEASKRNWADPAIRGPMQAKMNATKRTPEYRQKLRAITKASWEKMEDGRKAGLEKMRATKRSPENREFQAAENRRRWADPAYKDRVRVSIAATFASLEYRQFFAAALTARWANPQFRQMMIRRIKEGQRTPQARANHSVAQKRLFANPAKAEVLRNAIEMAQARFREIVADPQQKAELVARILESRRLTYAVKKGQPLGIISAEQITNETLALILDEFGHARAA